MSTEQLIYAILAMAVAMFVCRVVPLFVFKNKIKNKFLNSVFAYIPYAVLTSLTFPEVFIKSTGNPLSATIGVVTAVILSYFEKGLVTVLISSTLAVFIANYVISLIA